MSRMKKRWLCLLTAALLALCLCACGSSPTESKTLDMTALQTQLLEKADQLPEMQSVSSADSEASSLFSYLSTLDYDKVAGYLLSYSSSGTADEIALVQVKDSADLDAAKQSLEEHLQQRQRLFQQYSPAEAKRAEDALLYTRGDCVVLLICDQASELESLINEAIG